MIISYAFKWVTQRVTAILLIPLTFWFIYNCISFKNLKYIELQIFFKSYINSILFLILMTAMLIHAKLGCETIIQDYFSNIRFRKIFKIIINFITLSSLLLSIGAIIKLNIGI